MNAPSQAELPPDQENRRLHARVVELEQDVSRLRRCLEGLEQRSDPAHDQTVSLIRHLMEGAPVGFALYDTGFRYLVVNQTLAARNGITAGMHIGRTVEEIVPDLAVQAHRAFRHVLETGSPLLDREFTGAIASAPGTLRSWSESWFPVHAPDGKLLGVGCVIAEVTERKRAEEALCVSQQRLELAQAAAGIGVWDWDALSNQTWCSREYGLLYGRPQCDFSPPLELWLEWIHPGDRARVRDDLLSSVAAGQIYSTEFRVVWLDGSIHWLFCKGQVFRDARGTPLRMLGVNMDITDRKRAEAALRESEERFRTMADTAPVMICASGPDKLATFFNKGWLQFTGRSMEQELGFGWVEGIHPDDRERALAAYTASCDARRICRIEYRLRRADGEDRTVLCTGVPRFQPDGIFAGYIATCIDLTDLKRAQEEALARQKLESLGVLAGGIAHDFNNLLGSILADSELLLADLAAGSPSHNGATRIKAVSIRAAEIVRELMAYAGEENALFESVGLSTLVGEMIQLLNVSISKRAVLKIDLPASLPPIRANAAQLRQVVMNLITNASEALGECEGSIFVGMRQVRFGEGLDPYISLEVADTGCGMTEETQSRIFDPFFTTKFAGRGLGLAAVQGIIRSHGGTINVTSTPGQGTRFEILFPCLLHLAPGPRDIVRPTVPQSVSPAATVLLVEDEESLRSAISTMLRRSGYRVIEAGDGRTAVDLFRAREAEIDVVLLDLTLPRVSGREVFNELRGIRPGVRVILTTAYSRDNAMTALGPHQPWLFIRKPYEFRELTRLLQTACSPTPS
jgi:PAS domain S-box-containing protein